MPSICIFTSICEEDQHWTLQYLREVRRLGLPFAIHFDRCSAETKSILRSEAYAWTQRDSPREFEETDKQGIFDAVVARGFQWALPLDVDETFERSAPDRIRQLMQLDVDCVDVRWLNLWNDDRHVRVDRGFADGHRVKLYNLQGGRTWKFESKVVNGAKLQERKERVDKRHDLVCLHWGMMTPTLRNIHKDRWDRIYSTALRGDPNPYGFWKDAIATQDSAVVVKHGYF